MDSIVLSVESFKEWLTPYWGTKIAFRGSIEEVNAVQHALLSLGATWNGDFSSQFYKVDCESGYTLFADLKHKNSIRLSYSTRSTETGFRIILTDCERIEKKFSSQSEIWGYLLTGGVVENVIKGARYKILEEKLLYKRDQDTVFHNCYYENFFKYELFTKVVESSWYEDKNNFPCLVKDSNYRYYVASSYANPYIYTTAGAFYPNLVDKLSKEEIRELFGL